MQYKLYVCIATIFTEPKQNRLLRRSQNLLLPHCLCSIQLRSYHLSRELYRFFICQCLAHLNPSKPSTCSILWCSVAFEICSWYRREGICEELSHELASPLLTMPLCHPQTMYNKRCDGVSSTIKELGRLKSEEPFSRCVSFRSTCHAITVTTRITTLIVGNPCT